MKQKILTQDIKYSELYIKTWNDYINFFYKLLNYLFMFQCNEYVEMNKVLCNLACS